MLKHVYSFALSAQENVKWVNMLMKLIHLVEPVCKQITLVMSCGFTWVMSFDLFNEKDMSVLIICDTINDRVVFRLGVIMFGSK